METGRRTSRRRDELLLVRPAPVSDRTRSASRRSPELPAREPARTRPDPASARPRSRGGCTRRERGQGAAARPWNGSCSSRRDVPGAGGVAATEFFRRRWGWQRGSEALPTFATARLSSEGTGREALPSRKGGSASPVARRMAPLRPRRPRSRTTPRALSALTSCPRTGSGGALRTPWSLGTGSAPLPQHRPRAGDSTRVRNASSAPPEDLQASKMLQLRWRSEPGRFIPPRPLPVHSRRTAEASSLFTL